MLVLADCIHHAGDIIDGNTDVGGRELAVGVAANRLMDVSHQHGMTDEKVVAFDSFPTDQGDGVAGKNKIARLEG
jgi:hypothetical protein